MHDLEYPQLHAEVPTNNETLFRRRWICPDESRRTQIRVTTRKQVEVFAIRANLRWTNKGDESDIPPINLDRRCQLYDIQVNPSRNGSPFRDFAKRVKSRASNTRRSVIEEQRGPRTGNETPLCGRD